jgi:hypothetical protein
MNRTCLNFSVVFGLIFGTTGYAQESLNTCTAEKTHQMELIRSIKLAPEPKTDPYTRRTYNSFDKVRAQDDVNRIDEWLWKNCREYSEELRKVEQQYM